MTDQLRNVMDFLDKGNAEVQAAMKRNDPHQAIDLLVASRQRVPDELLQAAAAKTTAALPPGYIARFERYLGRVRAIVERTTK